jgi:hypothetical protein
VGAGGQITDLRHFCRVLGYAGEQKFRHSLLLFPVGGSLTSLCVPSLRNRAVRRLCEMRITFLPHALERMAEYGVTEDEVRLIVDQPDEEGTANFGCRYAQKVLGHRRIRVVYNRGTGVRMRPWS